MYSHTKETFEERPILAKYKEGDNKGLGSWFTVSGSWLKTTRNYKPETKNFHFTNDIRCPIFDIR
jgi:hypothetical protein